FGIFLLFPIGFPIFSIIQRPLLAGGNIPDGRVQPNIKFFPCGFFQRNIHAPVQVACHGARLQSRFEPELHWPYTLDFHLSFLPSRSHFSSQGWYLSSGRYQCLVLFSKGVLPLRVDLGLIRSVGFSEVPHFSHWSP